MAKKKKDKKEKKGKDTEEVEEIFEVKKKDGKTVTKKTHKDVPKEHASKKEVQKYNVLLRNILIGIAVIFVLVMVSILFLNNVRNFEYRGVEGEVVQEGDLIFYHMVFPYFKDGIYNKYNIFLYNNPNDLHDKIPFNGDVEIGARFEDGKYRMVLDIASEFDCNEGDQVIAVANMMNLEAASIKVVKDENATCDPAGRYMHVTIEEGASSEANQIGPACYRLTVNDCEILEVTERFMMEILVAYNDVVGKTIK